MPCTICEEPTNENPRRIHIIIKGENGLVVRSEEQHPVCDHCYSRGDYSSLACAVINAAISDYCGPKLDSIIQKTAITAHRMEAAGFLFGDNLEFWAGLTGLKVEDIRTGVQKRRREAERLNINPGKGGLAP